MLAIDRRNDHLCGAAHSAEAAGGALTAPGGTRLQLAVGFDALGAWISAQQGALAMRKHTSHDAQETTIALQFETDLVTLRIRRHRLLVMRECRMVAVDDGAAVAAASDLLADSPAVLAARATSAELESADPHGPEMSVLSALTFVADLAAHRSCGDGLPHACSSFLLRESVWLRSVVALQPLEGAVPRRPTHTGTASFPRTRTPARVAGWIARATRLDPERRTAGSAVRLSSPAARNVA